MTLAPASTQAATQATKSLFSTFDITTAIFYSTPLSHAFVNLRPLVPGHVLVVPRRIVPRLSGLTRDEGRDVWDTVRRVGRVLERAYGAQGLTVSMQDGPVAGQSVPHVHVHLLPRHRDDITHNDSVYESLDTDEERMQRDWTAALHNRRKIGGVDDDSRQPRTEQEMQEEAKWLATFFDGQDDDDDDTQAK